ncbi:hypothetical protein EKL30_05170 [Candidimonas sp. SYP-B2681]|nr:hypothetical protein EKL30_05170 [Candidimonas sp. SYP-B2681]
MNDDLTHYRNTPVGEQLLAHVEGRTLLRHSIPLFPFPIRALFAKKRSCHNNAQHTRREDSAYHAG